MCPLGKGVMFLVIVLGSFGYYKRIEWELGTFGVLPQTVLVFLYTLYKLCCFVY